MDEILLELKNKSEEARLKASDDLKDLVTNTFQENSVEAAGKFMNDLNRRLFDMLNSSDSNEKLGAISAIDRLITLDIEESSAKINRFSNYLRMVLPSNDFFVMAKAAKTMGRLALFSGTVAAEFVEFEVRRCLEWLDPTRERVEIRRYAAVVLLSELATNSSTLVFSSVSQILDFIWSGLRDPKVIIRESSAETMNLCLSLMIQRESSLRQQWFKKLYEESVKGIKSSSLEVIHGSLLALLQLFSFGNSFFNDKYNIVCESVNRFKDSKDPLIRKTIIQIIPVLAKFDSAEFSTSHLSNFMAYLLSLIKKEKEKSILFSSIGKIAEVVGSNITPFLDQIISSIKDSVASKGKSKNTIQDIAIFSCISMLSKSIGPSLSRYSQELIDLIFATGLHEDMCDALDSISVTVPSFSPIIQERLLDAISMTLCNQTYSASQSNPFKPAFSINISMNSAGGNAKDGSYTETKDLDSIVAALNILKNFDFSGFDLLDFVNDYVSLFLEDDNNEVRKSAVTSCCKLLKSSKGLPSDSDYVYSTIINEAVEKLLVLGITDPDPGIRKIVLSSLSSKFDIYLTNAENIRGLFISLNDEVFDIRKESMGILGRLSHYNPAYILPSLRKILIQTLTEIEYSSVTKHKEDASRLLSFLIQSSQRIIKPYVNPILKVLLPKLGLQQSPAVIAGILSSIGELANVGGEALCPYLPNLCPIIIETLQDQSSSTKRHSALKTFGQLSCSTSYVIEPYLDYPNLLNILIGILKMEQAPDVRRETLKLMGVIGALDPYRYKVAQTDVDSDDCFIVPEDDKVDVDLDPAFYPMMTGLSPSNEEYYPTVVIHALMKILRDSSLSSYHKNVIQAMMSTFKSLGSKCISFLPLVMPPFFAVMKSCPSDALEFYLQQIGTLVRLVKQHIRNYLEELFGLIRDNWGINTSIQITILLLIDGICSSLEGEFRIHLPSFLPLILQVFESDTSDRRHLSHKALQTLENFGSNMEEYLHLVIPSVVKIMEKADAPLSLRRSAIQAIGKICKKIHFADHASKIIHPLMRILNYPNQDIKVTAIDSLCSIAFRLGQDFSIFIPVINKILMNQKLNHPQYEILVSKILKNEPLPASLGIETEDKYNDPYHDDQGSDANPKKLPVNQQNLQKSFEASQKSTKDDWVEWIRRFSVELLKESPSPALRACATLASGYHPLARELFDAGFVSCWPELYDQFQDELLRALETALTSPSIPTEIVQIILNLAEFMEHDERPLPIDIKMLGAYASKCHAFAKALHYKELEFMAKPLTNTIETLISINNQLQQPDAAIGILKYAQQQHNVELKESWYEKLQRWDDALAAYEKRAVEDPSSFDVTLGIMRCLHALGDWEALSSLCQEKWKASEEKDKIAPLAAAASWGLKEWDSMEEYIKEIESESVDGAFFRAILALHRNNFDMAKNLVDKTRDLLDTELTALVGESYNRSYNVMVRVQMLAELDEIIDYKLSYDDQSKLGTMRKTWMNRLNGCQRNVEVWQRILKVRFLVISPEEDMEMWIQFANLCRKSGRLNLCQKTLSNLLKLKPEYLADLTFPNAPPQVIYSYLKYSWVAGERRKTYDSLKVFTHNLANDLEIRVMNENPSEYFSFSLESHSKLLARCFLKLGEWQMSLAEELNIDAMVDTIDSFLSSTNYDKNWYKAWHSWALANFEVISALEKGREAINRQVLLNYVVPAIQGFFRSISLSKDGALQDTLRLLTLWFNHGSHAEVSMAIGDGFNSVKIDTWLQVIPQLIARIHANSHHVRRLIHQLLSDIGKEHPQALIYSLTVASKSQNSTRKTSAAAIMDKMRNHCANLVDQAKMVSEELIRVAILWHEMWHEGLEEASRLFFGEKKIDAMFRILDPLHQMMERGPETLREISFNQAFGRDLQEAQEWCRKYKRSNNVNDLNQAWDLYYHVFRRINKQLPQLTTLELQYVSPRLLAAKDLDLAVPGTYKSNSEIIRIAMFYPTLTVITSKQRPRKFTIKGSNDRDYQYLLKGHEDLRQDERVMQLFGLINTLLASDAETFKRHLSIQRYPVIPLSPNSGLIGWVPHCDTLHSLIREYREGRKILLNREHRLMLQMAPDYDNLPLLHKVEVFEYAISNSDGQDLYKILWLKSKNSEVWLERRTNYSRSLAVMSIAGYILGLGDRHPSNLMLDRITGKIIHIDFGDCFEVAMHREKFPEKIPFRLTRMLANAMEVSGIEGTFRITCENVMRVLRSNKESLMAVLEAFVYDPLINWRLLHNTSPKVISRGPAKKGETTGRDLIEDKPRNFPTGRKLQKNENELVADDENSIDRAVFSVVNRVSNKLTGRDFKPNVNLDVSTQVQKLIEQATSIENLCQCYIGWCPFW